jgi:hypothetical protein
VLFTVDPAVVHEIRRELGKRSRHGHITVVGGEFRADIGCYSLLPPSRTSKGRYAWIVPLPKGPLPTIDPRRLCEAKHGSWRHGRPPISAPRPCFPKRKHSHTKDGYRIEAEAQATLSACGT